jgi:hypothetical protein
MARRTSILGCSGNAARCSKPRGDPEPQLKPFDPASLKPFAFEDKLAAYPDKKVEESRANPER